jgi:hypothetical protein
VTRELEAAPTISTIDFASTLTSGYLMDGRKKPL